MGIFYNLSKIMKLVPFILIIDGTSKQHKIMPQKDFYQSLKGLSWFKAYFTCALISDGRLSDFHRRLLPVNKIVIITIIVKTPCTCVSQMYSY